MKEHTEQSSSFQRINRIPVLQISQKDALQMVKVKDLHALANSIIEIMVGKAQEDPSNSILDQLTDNAERLKSRGRLATGGIPLDMIPLNWSKTPEISSILKILNTLFGPYNRRGTHEVETHEILSQVTQIAQTTYKNNFGREDGLAGSYLNSNNDDHGHCDHVKRLLSH